MMIALGFLGAASIRVSNELGSGKSKAAKFSIIVTVSTSLAIGLVLFVFFPFFHGHLAYIFTKSQEVAKAVAHLSPLQAFSILLNSVQPVLSGVAIGDGQQSRVAYVNIGSYYIIGILVGVVLGYIIKLQVEISIARRRVDRWFVEAETDTNSVNRLVKKFPPRSCFPYGMCFIKKTQNEAQTWEIMQIVPQCTKAV
ncbi:unnamed protein product [Fraxinus pennsylvanica]|uniref:MATE efflux family protein n=1 Tax=Fraxinus pennsylvanica TaxID=56036 RepID=A0AAD2A7M6_9LAMI|nr:unnamed protein product [Fraxinus pennsylvanica]